MTIKDRLSLLKFSNKLKNIKIIISDVDGVMTNGDLLFDDNGNETKIFNALDGSAIAMALNAGIKIAIISGSKSNSIINRFKKFSKINPEDIIIGTENKLPTLLTLIEKYGFSKEECAYIGDDIIDLAPIHNAGISFAPKNAIKEVKKESNIVLSKNGGNGAVRLAIEMILRAKGNYDEIIQSYY